MSALHPDFAHLAALLGGMTLDISDIGPARERFASMTADPDWAPPADVTVADWRIAGAPGSPDVGVRVYRPAAADAERAAALLFLHGGSFSFGDLDTENAKCADLAARSGCLVVSVDYRLAPEHPYPAALDDARAALGWLAASAGELGVDPERIAVGGSSAGGGLAAALALAVRDRGGPAIRAQVLLCPPLDDALDTRSMRTFVDTPIYQRAAAETMWRYYLGAGHRPGTAEAYAAPARAADLSGLPRTVLVVAGLDPLRDEGLDFARRLIAAGNDVDLLHVAGAPHGFDAFLGIAASDAARAFAVAGLAAALADA